MCEVVREVGRVLPVPGVSVKLHPHKMPPEPDTDVEVLSMEFKYKLHPAARLAAARVRGEKS